jgi:NADH-quinone oxidoreductase subunit E
MLSERETREIEEAAREYPRRDAACIDALRIVQSHRRWISDEAIADVAEILGLSHHEVDSIATFYNLIHRRPVGRHVAYCCDSVSCWILGAQKLIEALAEKTGARLGETTEDDRFTLLPIACLGACDRAPALMIDDDLHQDVEVERLDPILERYR